MLQERDDLLFSSDVTCYERYYTYNSLLFMYSRPVVYFASVYRADQSNSSIAVYESYVSRLRIFFVSSALSVILIMSDHWPLPQIFCVSILARMFILDCSNPSKTGRLSASCHVCLRGYRGLTRVWTEQSITVRDVMIAYTDWEELH